ncbi:MAG: WavE lipopolysaccharide synthesis family protein, partial [Acidobacteriota bacterium]|nr:WavE lipopolysaccharide synthesis family protein [Acidobacteriota bacterium]
MKTRDLSFVVQGAIDREISPLTGRPITQSCLESLRKHYPGAEVILSTWQGQDVAGLDCDQLILNEDPGAWNAFRPGAEVKLDNTNRQIVSTRNGLRAAGGRYAAKVRSDMIFQGNDWLRHYDLYPARGTEWNVFEERVITCSMWARDPRCPYTDQPLHPPDWV